MERVGQGFGVGVTGPGIVRAGDRQQVGPYDSFVYAYGGIRVDTLSEPLKEKGIRVETVGDAFSPRTLQHAILEGHKYARSI